jgi:hypothetical protein
MIFGLIAVISINYMAKLKKTASQNTKLMEVY